MAESAWRDAWPQHRVDFVDETSHCLADHQSLMSGGQIPPWSARSEREKSQLTEFVAWVFLSQERAMETLVKRGQIT